MIPPGLSESDWLQLARIYCPRGEIPLSLESEGANTAVYIWGGLLFVAFTMLVCGMYQLVL